MKIVIVRHGDAVYSKDDRVLSVVGQEEAHRTGKKLKNLINPDLCFSSPKTRALETCSIICDEIGFSNKIEYLSSLTPSGNPRDIIDYLEALDKKNATIMLVSHLPLVEILSYEFNRKIQRPPQFGTACALILDYNGEIGHYERFVSPDEDDYVF